MEKELSILIVDDSRVFRSILERLLVKIEGVRIAGSVWSGEKALEFLQDHAVDLVTLDVEMPGLDGLETLLRIGKLPEKRRPGVLMVSSLTRSGADTTVRALEQGAFDFVAKPGPEMQGGAESLERMLAMKIKGWRSRCFHQAPAADMPVIQKAVPIKAPSMSGKLEVVLIGVSTGGPKALTEMLPLLSERISCPVLIVQHMPPEFTKSLAQTLDKKCAYTIVEAAEGMQPRPKHMYIAPGGMHMVVRRGRQGIELGLNQQEPENGCRPSVDVLFRSAADVYEGSSMVAVVLTGMGCDGTAGARQLKRKGAYCIAQDEESSVVWGMPGALVEAGLADEQAPLLQIPASIAKRA